MVSDESINYLPILEKMPITVFNISRSSSAFLSFFLSSEIYSFFAFDLNCSTLKTSLAASLFFYLFIQLWSRNTQFSR